MGQPAAKQGDHVIATDTHTTPAGVPTAMPFAGVLMTGLSPNVNIMGKPAAVVGSGAINLPPHPVSVPPATNQGTVVKGSATVMINNKPAARSGDTATTCNDAGPLPIGTVNAVGTVNFG